MQDSSSSIHALLDGLTVEQLEALNNKLQVKTSKPTVVKTLQIIHEYHCELCEGVHKQSYPVKITPYNGALVERHKKPIILYTICQTCIKALIVGMAFTLMLFKKQPLLESPSEYSDLMLLTNDSVVEWEIKYTM